MFKPNLSEDDENQRFSWRLGLLQLRLWLLLRVKIQNQGCLLRAVGGPILLIWSKRGGRVVPVTLARGREIPSN